MKNLLACLTVFVAFSAGAQSTMPWNPDANDDSYVGASDMLSTLAVYGQQIGIDSSLTCDYDGTPIEEFWGNVWNGDVIIDSMLVQYHTFDSAQVFIAGCPDPVWETVSYERAWITTGFNENYGNNQMYWTGSLNGYSRQFFLRYYSTVGVFNFFIWDSEVADTGLDEVLGGQIAHAATSVGDNSWMIPFELGSATLDETGIHFENWQDFLSGATYVNILPYWHYAE